MKMNKTKIAVVVSAVLAQPAFAASMTVTGEINTTTPTVQVTPKGTLYEGVKESEIKLSSNNEGCRVVYKESAVETLQPGVLGCYLVIDPADLPVGIEFDPGQARLIGTTAQSGQKAVPYKLFYKSGSAGTPEEVGSGVLPFLITPTLPPVITNIFGRFDEPVWDLGKEPSVHRRSTSGQLKFMVEPRPFDQRIVISDFSNCVVKEGEDNCVAVNNSMQDILGESETGNKPMLVSANSTNNYFAPVNDQVALSWDFRPPLVGANVQGNTESPLQTIETTEGVQDVPYSTIAVIVNSPHNDQSKSWWHPATLKMVLTPDPESPRKIYLSYKSRQLLSVAGTTHDNTTVAATPVGNYIVTGPQQFRYNFDMNTIKDGDFLVKMKVTDQYGNTSTSDARPIRLDRYGPQVGLYGPDLSAVADGEVVFFPERLTVASYNGYTGGVVETKATLGGVELPLSPTDTEGVFTVGKTDLSALTSGESYPLIVTAKDKADRVTTKTYQVRYAATALSLSPTPANPVQFVQRVSVKVDNTGYNCPINYTQEQAAEMAATYNKIACYAEWDLPPGMEATVSVLGNVVLEGFVDDTVGRIGYTLHAVSPEGYVMEVTKGSVDLKPTPATEPVISFQGRRKQGDDGLMIDIHGGVAGSAIVNSSPGDLDLTVNIPGVGETTNSIRMRPRPTGGDSKTSAIIKVPKGDIWTVYPVEIKAKYSRTNELSATKEGKVYIVPSKNLKINMSGMDRESVDNETSTISSSIGEFDSKTKQINYRQNEHGEWNMRLMQVVTSYKNGNQSKTFVPLTDIKKTDAEGKVDLVFDPSKAEGRSITYVTEGEVISPFAPFKLKIVSAKRHLNLIKGVGVDGTPNVTEIVDQVPMKATIKVKPDSEQDKDALGEVEWQIRSGDSGAWVPAPEATGRLSYVFTTEEPGKWQVRAILHNRLTNVTNPTDITTLVAYAKPDIQLVQKKIVLKGQPIPLEVTGSHGAEIDDALNVQWSTDGKHWEDGDRETEMMVAPDSNYLYARAEFANSQSEAEASSWVTTKIMPKVLTPAQVRASVTGPDKVEINKPFTLTGSYKNDYQLVEGVKYQEEWVLPDGTVRSGHDVVYTPTEDGKTLPFTYRVWLDGYKETTVKEVVKEVDTWAYYFPTFYSGQRQYFKLAPTTIEVRNTTKLPSFPGVVYDIKVTHGEGVTDVSFDKEKGRYVGTINEPGIHSVFITLSDNRGNSETQEHLFAVDESEPMQAKITPSYSNQFMRAPLSVNMSSSIELDHPSDNLKEFSWVLDGVLVKDTMRRQLFANLPEGDHTIEFKALSDFGQRALVRHDFTVLKNKPAECDLQQSDTTTSWRVKMSCVDTDGRIVAYRWKIDGETIGNTSYAISLTKALNPGSHEIEAVAIDDSGDETKDSTTLTGQ